MPRQFHVTSQPCVRIKLGIPEGESDLLIRQCVDECGIDMSLWLCVHNNICKNLYSKVRILADLLITILLKINALGTFLGATIEEWTFRYFFRGN